jgi:hypothetical protein
MNYKEYYKAAQRHRETCEYLINKLNDRQEYIDVHRQKKLLQNIYYLSGYVIECIISYSFFNIICFDNKKSVYDLENHNCYGYSFQKYFREHSKIANDLRIEEIRKRGGNIPSSLPIIGEKVVDEITKKMYEQWDAKSRYTNIHLTFELDRNNVFKFFNLANEIYTNIQKI